MEKKKVESDKVDIEEMLIRSEAMMDMISENLKNLSKLSIKVKITLFQWILPQLQECGARLQRIWPNS